MRKWTEPMLKNVDARALDLHLYMGWCNMGLMIMTTVRDSTSADAGDVYLSAWR
jgi:hypothetical protein